MFIRINNITERGSEHLGIPRNKQRLNYKKNNYLLGWINYIIILGKGLQLTAGSIIHGSWKYIHRR